MRPALDPTGHRVPRTKPTYLLHTWRPHRQRPFALVLHLHQHESSCNLHLQYLAKNQSTQRYQSLITQGSDHPPFLEPHMVLTLVVDYFASATRPGASARRAARHAARRRLLRLAQARRRLLRLRRASRRLRSSRGTSRGSSRRSSSTTLPRAGSSSTTLPLPRVRVPRHVTRLVTRLVALLVVDYTASRKLAVDYSASRRLVVDYFASAARLGASARRAARHAARRAAHRRLFCVVQAHRRLLRLT
jgi:hypothetical protein